MAPGFRRWGASRWPGGWGSTQQKPCLLRKAEGIWGRGTKAQLQPEPTVPLGKGSQLTPRVPDPLKGWIWRPNDLGNLMGGNTPIPLAARVSEPSGLGSEESLGWPGGFRKSGFTPWGQGWPHV